MSAADDAGDESGTDYASSDDGAMPFSDEPHTDHFGTFSQEGESFAPLVETPLTAVRRLLEIAELQSTERLVDVGCGDGRIVVAAAEHFGCEAVGIDLFDDRLGDAAVLATEKKVTDRTSFLQADAREFDFGGFDVVVVFLLPAALAIILPKLRQCLASGARVASYWFPVDGLMCVAAMPPTSSSRQHCPHCDPFSPTNPSHTCTRARGITYREDADVEVTSDPTGEIRVFVYKLRTGGSAAADGGGGGGQQGGGCGGVRWAEQQMHGLGLKHTVTGERSDT